MSDPRTITYFMGELVEEMSRERLIEVVKILARMLDDTQQNNLENHKFYQAMLKRQRELYT